MRTALRRLLIGAGLLAVLSGGALAGQIRIDVSNVAGANAFFPPAASCNLGDHVVWVFIKGGHTVTSGATCTSDGKFNSGTLMNPSTAYTWKSISSGAVPYFCSPHCTMGMVGTLNVGTGIDVADFRITEVQYSTAGNLDLIEITNMGNASGDLGRYRIFTQNDSAMVPADNWVVPKDSSVVIHVNTAGVQVVPSNMYLPTLADLSTTGSLALMVPYSVGSGASPVSVLALVDFLQWGATGQLRESQAASTTPPLWTVGQTIPTVQVGHSIEFCGTAASHGMSNWAEISVPNFGSRGGCSTPTLQGTWGRLKAIYR